MVSLSRGQCKSPSDEAIIHRKISEGNPQAEGINVNYRVQASWLNPRSFSLWEVVSYSLAAEKLRQETIIHCTEATAGKTEWQGLRKGRQMVAGQPEVSFIDCPHRRDMHQKRRTPVSIAYIILAGNQHTLKVVIVGS